MRKPTLVQILTLALVAGVLALGSAQAQDATPSAVVTCGPNLATGEVRLIPGGCTVGGDVEISASANGPWKPMYAGEAGVGTTTRIIRDIFVRAPWGAGVSTMDPRTAALQTLKDGCGQSNGCNSVLLNAFQVVDDQGILRVSTIRISDGDFVSACPNEANAISLEDGKTYVLPAGCTVGGRLEVVVEDGSPSRFWPADEDLTGFTLRTEANNVIVRMIGNGGLTTRDPIQAARESLINGCGDKCLKAVVAFFGSRLNRLLTLPDDNWRAYENQLPLIIAN